MKILHFLVLTEVVLKLMVACQQNETLASFFGSRETVVREIELNKN